MEAGPLPGRGASAPAPAPGGEFGGDGGQPLGQRIAAAVVGAPEKGGQALEKVLESPVTLTLGYLHQMLWRLLQLAAAVVAFSVITTSKQNGMLFQDFQAFNFLVAATVIAAAWSLGHLLYNFATLLSPKWRAYWSTMLEFAIAWLALAAGSAAAAVTTFADHGTGSIYRGYCQDDTPYPAFCSRTKVAVAFAIITFFFFIPTLMTSVRNLIAKSYQDKKG